MKEIAQCINTLHARDIHDATANREYFLNRDLSHNGGRYVRFALYLPICHATYFPSVSEPPSLRRHPRAPQIQLP